MSKAEAATKIPTSLHQEHSELQHTFTPESRASAPVASQGNDHPVLTLQRTIGNRAVQQMLNSWSLQPKLVVGAPDDAYEQEADKVAEEVVSRQGALQRQAIGSGSTGSDD